MFDLSKLKEEWKSQGHKDKDIAELIGVSSQHFSKTLNDPLKKGISANQAALICTMLEKPMDMFVTKNED